MLIRYGYDILYQFPDKTAVTVLLQVLPQREPDLVLADAVHLDPPVAQDSFKDCFGNRCVRFVAPKGTMRVFGDTIIKDNGIACPIVLDAVEHDIPDLPPETLEFLLPSRYCEVDKLTEIAWQMFGQLPRGWPLVQAINDWVHKHIQFGYQHASPTKTAFDVYCDQLGVCRDYTHLAITFCRAMNIPARYATGYLGDIGVPKSASPMDFSACYQVFLGGQWHTFDARFNQRRVGWVLLAVGRDAADCALTTSFGPHLLQNFTVWSDEVESSELTPRE
jgi:transglutaminase-like putative cysteine protease